MVEPLEGGCAVTLALIQRRDFPVLIIEHQRVADVFVAQAGDIRGGLFAFLSFGATLHQEVVRFLVVVGLGVLANLTAGDVIEDVPEFRFPRLARSPDDAICNANLFSHPVKTSIFSTIHLYKDHPLKVKIGGSTPVRATKSSAARLFRRSQLSIVRQNFRDRAMRLVDGHVRVGVAAGIGVGDNDAAEALAADHPRLFFFFPIGIKQRIGGVSVSVGPTVYRDPFDVPRGSKPVAPSILPN